MLSMSTSTNHQIPPDDPLSQAYLLVSRAMDERLSVAEESELTRLEAIYPQELKSFRSQCQQIRTTMRLLPVTPVGSSLFVQPPADAKSVSSAGAVSTATGSTATGSTATGSTATGELEIHKPRPFEEPQTRSGAQRLVVGIVTSVLCGVLFLSLNRSPDDAASTPMMAELSPLSSEHSLASDRPFSLETSDEMMVGRIPGAAAPLESPAATAPVMEADMPTLLVENSGASEDDISIAPLIQSDNWNVVVVKVDGHDRDMAMDRIQAIVKEHGLRLQKSAGQDQSEWLGVVLTSAVDQNSEVLTAMERDLGEQSPAKGAADSKVAESTSLEIIAAVRESLRYPTRSELHHGRIFVALPTQQEAKLAIGDRLEESKTQNADVAASAARAKEDHSLQKRTAKASELALVKPEAARQDDKTAAAANAQQVPAVVTLVVFEFH